MESSTEASVLRLLALDYARDVLEREDALTSVARRKIERCIGGILREHPEIVGAIETFQVRAIKVIQEISLETPSIPLEIRRTLGRRERLILDRLLQHYLEGGWVSKATLEKDVYGDKPSKELKVLICKLRPKIAAWGKILNKPGVGYRLELEPK